MYAAVIDKFDKVIGNININDIPKSRLREIEIAGALTFPDGAPVNVQKYKYSTAKKYQKNEAEFLKRCEYKGRIFFM